jgi:hypothetical protein
MEGTMILKTLAIAAIVVVGAAGALVAYASTRPDTFRVARSTSIEAPPERIFPLISNLRGFASWSPYEAKDPDMKRAYSGPVSGKGAAYEWEGDKNVGKGRLEIAEATPSSNVTMKLDMIKPFAAHNIVEFTLQPNGAATNITWAMNGRTPLLAKVVHVFLDVDRMVGRDFEAGLGKLRAIAER